HSNGVGLRASCARRAHHRQPALCEIWNLVQTRQSSGLWGAAPIRPGGVGWGAATSEIRSRPAIGQWAATSEIMSRTTDSDAGFPIVDLAPNVPCCAPGFAPSWRVRRPPQLATGHLACRQGDRPFRRLQVVYRHFPFVQEDLCLVFLDQHIKDRASHGDDRRRRVDAIRIRLTSEFLDMDARLPSNYVEEGAWRSAQVFDDDRRLRRDHRL